MSLFRKPKKRMQMRSLANDDDEELNGSGNSMDVDENIPQAPPPPSLRPKRDKAKEKTKPKQTLLSFGDEVEEDAEIFQVKKSSQSKKLMKRMDRERQGSRRCDQDEAPPLDRSPRQHRTVGGAANGSGQPEKTDGDPSINSRKNDSYHKEKRSLEGVVLTGRAAIAAIRDGDVSGSDDSGSDPDGAAAAARDGADSPPLPADGTGRFKHSYVRHSGRSVRALLDSGAIPDAAVIHAARKKRQQARDGADFIPCVSGSAESGLVPPASRGAPGPHDGGGGGGGRLVREDGEGDGSDEDPDRILVRGVGPQHSKRETINMAVADNGSDVDSGGEEWESQQIRKAVTHSQIMAAQQESYYGTAYVMPAIHQLADSVEMNPFAVAPSQVTEASLSREHLRPLAPTGQDPVTVAQLTEALKIRLTAMQSAQTVRKLEAEQMEEELAKLQRKREGSEKRAPQLASRYEFYQRLRAYITDLVECLDEKMPALCALEARAMTLHKRKAAYLTERRRADVRDQAQEVMQPAQVGGKKDEERSRRIAEREGRRLRRRRARELLAPPPPHRDGDSSDQEVPQQELANYSTTMDQILADAGVLFSDTLEEFSSLAAVLARMEGWRRRDQAAYLEAYAALCLPKLAGPFLRLKLLLWNPIADEDAPDWEKMQWYRGLMLYGLSEDDDQPETEESLAADPDITLIPNIVMKVIIPKLTELVEGTWDPMSSAQSRRLAALLRRLAAMPGAGPSSRYLTALAEAVVRRAQAALQHDVFIPLLPKSIVEGTKGGGLAFLRRQTARGARLLANLAALHGAIADSTLAPLALGALLQRYLLAGVRCCPPVYGAELCWAIGSCLPRAWERNGPPLQQFLLCCQEVLANLTDNPLHLKAVEQVRSTIAILQGGPSG